jgi:hypothetical protein
MLEWKINIELHLLLRSNALLKCGSFGGKARGGGKESAADK